MLSGARAFRRPTSVETLNAILKEEPPEFPEERKVPPALDRIVRHCLEKKPQDRVQSARDLAFELEGLSDASGSGGDRTKPAAASRARRRWAVPVAVAVLAVAAVAAFLAGRRTAPSGALRFQRLTFRRGPVWSARFAPDGQSIVYGAAWDGQPIRLFTTRPGSAESRPMDLPDADLLAISRDGELALSLDRNRRAFVGWSEGTLARAPLGGGAPRPALEHVAGADWSPDGKDLAIVRVGQEGRVEYPIGRVLFRGNLVFCPRVSRSGDAVAFVAGTGVHVVDRAGKILQLTPRAPRGPNSLAWSPDGREVWFGASFHGDEWAIYGVDLRGHLRVVAELPLAGHLYDVAPDGRALLTIQEERAEMFAASEGSGVEKNLSWLDWSNPGSLSQDGRFVVFREAGHGGARVYPWYLRRTDGSTPAVKVAEGVSYNGWASLSPDAAWLVQSSLDDPRQVRLVPVGPGEPRTVPIEGAELADNALRFILADDRRFVFCGRQPGGPARSWALDLADGRARPVSPEGQCVEATSPDGRVMVVRDSGRLLLYSIDGGPPRVAPGPPETADPLVVTTDGRTVFLRETDEAAGYAARIIRRDLVTGRREPWKELHPADQAGIVGMRTVVSPDGRTFVYSVTRSLSSLYLVEGLR
jgi:Tol biopolymer transport system component